MKKKLFLAIAMMALLVCLFALSISAARVEDYDDTFTLQNQASFVHYEKWFYNEGKSYVRKGYADSVTISFIDESGNPLTEVAMWEYDEEDGKHYSLVWYISDYELSWEDQTYTDDNVGTQTYPKYTSAVYTLTSVRAVDLRYYTYNSDRKYSSIESWTENRSLKTLEGIYYDVNNTPDDTSDDLKLQDAVGIGRDADNYGYVGYEAQWEATGNKIVVGNFRDCDFQCDMEGNYGTANTWSRADNLQCLWYPDTMLYISGGIGSVYEADLGDGMEIIACQVLRDNKRVKEFQIPNSVLYLNNEAFRGSDLTTLIVGEGLIAHGSEPFLYTGGADNVYLSKNLLNDSYTGNIFRLVCNTAATIYFDGNLEQATSLMDEIIAGNSSYNGKITLIDYNAQTERGDVKNVALFYNYNRCDAFYLGQHDADVSMQFNGYMNDITFAGTCSREGCGCDVIDESKTIGAVFTYFGYSYTEGKLGGTYSMAQFFGVNEENLAKYEELMGTTLTFGVIAKANKVNEGETATAVKPSFDGGKVLYKDFTNDAHNYFEIKIAGIDSDNLDTKIVFCAYVIENGKMSYLNNNETVEELTGESYNDVVAIKNAE